MSKTLKRYCRRETFAFALLGFAVIAIAVMFLTGTLGSAAGKPAMSTPIIACGGSGQDYIDINVTAGSPTGAPAGFTIQWQTAGDYEQFGWPADSTCPPDENGVPTCGESLCKASFSGNAASSNYTLAAGQSVTVRIGNLLMGNGVSTDCPEAPLLCGHNYVFRTFAHASSNNQRSAFTGNLTCATTECPVDCDPNVKSVDFWKTHSTFCTGEGCQEDAWPPSVLESGLTIGCKTYNAQELEAILLTSGEGDCNTALLQQVIAAQLNIANGASQEYIDLTAETLGAADALLCDGEGDCASLTSTLDLYRSEFECPPTE
ncbi:MAG TPA: hypothetical protein VGQ39_10485 [Pyrinomonadaceae bacterium]|nr:hypothetical protein [Pyrinomonadaceae bacterium]